MLECSQKDEIVVRLELVWKIFAAQCRVGWDWEVVEFVRVFVLLSAAAAGMFLSGFAFGDDFCVRSVDQQRTPNAR